MRLEQKAISAQGCARHAFALCRPCLEYTHTGPRNLPSSHIWSRLSVAQERCDEVHMRQLLKRDANSTNKCLRFAY